MPLLTLEGVSRRFSRGRETVSALTGVDLSVEPGEFVSLVGPSGSGKSTLLHLAGGLDRPDTGRAILDGRDWGELSTAERARVRRRRIGFVFQFFHLLPNLTVGENVGLPLALEGRRDDRRVAALLEAVGLGHRARHLPSELSGGEMQRAAVARALVAAPGLILADEPTGNLDTATGADVLALLVSQVREVGAALLMVTHDAAAAAMADRRLSLRDGLVVPVEPAVLDLTVAGPATVDGAAAPAPEPSLAARPEAAAAGPATATAVVSPAADGPAIAGPAARRRRPLVARRFPPEER